MCWESPALLVILRPRGWYRESCCHYENECAALKHAPLRLNFAGLLLARFRLPEINACGLRTNVDGRDRFHGRQVDHFNRSRFVAHAFDADEGITIIRSDHRAVNDFSFRRNSCEFLSAHRIED